MEEQIVKFIAALRRAGVRVSLAESADAFLALDHMGIKDRETFKRSLQATLVKDADKLPLFDEFFALFFGTSGSSSMLNLSDELSPQEVEMFAQALRDLHQELRQLLERVIKGEQLSPDELNQLGKMVGLRQVDDLRYREWMVQRLEKALHFKEVAQALEDLMEMLAELGMDKARVEQLQQLFRFNQDALENQLRQYAGQRIVENMSEHPHVDDIDGLLKRPFNTLSDADMERLRKEVQRLASALKTRVALRQKRAKSGQLNAKATIRANLKHDNVPIELKHQERSLKPKLVILCDISTSMRACSELMLSLIYSLQDQIKKTSAFAFIDHLEYISPDFQGSTASHAVASVLERMPTGFYNTDLGNSLQDFHHSYLDKLDSHTTLIIVGDGRNNYNNPRLDLLSQLARRSRRTIWITPEPPVMWGSGDSDMLKYMPSCAVILQAATLAELITAVDKLLLA